MKKIFRKNQIIITALVLLIAVAGYINYLDGVNNKDAVSANVDPTAIETDPVSGDVIGNDVDPDPDATSAVDPGTAIYTGTQVSAQFIVEAKLEREQTRAAQKETLLSIINNPNLAEESKANAASSMVELANIADREVAAEIMLEAKGFSDAMVSITGSKVDVIVNVESLDDAQRAQIEDVVTRKTETSIENLNIVTVNQAKKSSGAENESKAPEETSAPVEETSPVEQETTPASK